MRPGRGLWKLAKQPGHEDQCKGNYNQVYQEVLKQDLHSVFSGRLWCAFVAGGLAGGTLRRGSADSYRRLIPVNSRYEPDPLQSGQGDSMTPLPLHSLQLNVMVPNPRQEGQ